MANAYFAGGCFWCITPTFRDWKGVENVISGYSGGLEENPTYEAVKGQLTAHRETIQIAYAPEQVSFETLLEIFLGGVDPFDAGGQFIDRGHSYTLAVYYLDEAQRSSHPGSGSGERQAGFHCYRTLPEFLHRGRISSKL